MKKTWMLTIAIALLICLRFPVTLPAPEPIVSHTEDTTAAISGKENLRLDQEQIATDIFNLIFQERKDQAAFDEKRLNYLLGMLDLIEKEPLPSGDKLAILYLRAETLFRMNEHKKAYVAFSRLKMRLGSKSHPLFSEVEQRLNTIRRQIVPIKKAPPLRAGNLHLLWALVILTLMFLFLLAMDYKKTGGKGYGSEIVEPGKLITLDDMREQDGRCSARTMEEYQALKKNHPEWNRFSPEQQEKYKFARLLDKGHGMIREVNQKAPVAIFWLPAVPLLNRIPAYFQYSAAGALFALLWWTASLYPKSFDPKDNFLMALLFAFTVACLASIKIMSQKTINALDELVSMLEPDHAEESIANLKTWIIDLFRSPRMLYFSLVVMGMILVCFYFQNKLILSSGNPNLDIVFSAVLVLLASQIIWFLTGSLFLIHKLFNLKDLSMNPLSPSKTMGLEKMIGVIGTYNILASFVFSLGCSIALYAAIQEGYSAAEGALWFFFITPILIFYWIYPYIRLGSLVKSKKLNRMNFVKTRIALLFDDWKTSEDRLLEIREDEKCPDNSCVDIKSLVEQGKKNIETQLKDMGAYYEIFRKIEQSPESYFDFNAVLELVKAMGFPSLFAIVAALFSWFVS